MLDRVQLEPALLPGLQQGAPLVEVTLVKDVRVLLVLGQEQEQKREREREREREQECSPAVPAGSCTPGYPAARAHPPPPYWRPARGSARRRRSCTWCRPWARGPGTSRGS